MGEFGIRILGCTQQKVIYRVVASATWDWFDSPFQVRECSLEEDLKGPYEAATSFEIDANLAYQRLPPISPLRQISPSE